MTEAFARNTDPATSHEAAKTVPTNVLESLVYASLLAAGPATSKVLAERLGLPRVSISPRLKLLEIKGLVCRTDKREGGGIVWRALDK